MAASDVAEVLYRAHKERATGCMKLVAGGRESRLLLKDGDLVGAQLGFGFQTVAQSLLQAGRIDSRQLDTLWARGEGGKVDGESLTEVGTTAREAAELQLLASVRRLSREAEAVQLELGEVEGDRTVAGARAVRAAFEALLRIEGKVFRCADPDACSEWLTSEEERAFLERFREFRVADDVPPEQAALLVLLAREGKVEEISEDEWHRLEHARWEEERRREAERLAEERRRAEELRLQEDARIEEAIRRAAELDEIRRADERRRLEEERFAEEARRAEQQRQLEAVWFSGETAAEPRAAEPIVADEVPTEQQPIAVGVDEVVPAAPDSQAQAHGGEGPTEPTTQRLPVPVEAPTVELPWGDQVATPAPPSRLEVPSIPDSASARPVEARAMAEARRRTEEDLIREMNEALRRAGAASSDDWLADKSAEPTIELFSAEIAEPAPQPLAPTFEVAAAQVPVPARASTAMQSRPTGPEIPLSEIVDAPNAPPSADMAFTAPTEPNWSAQPAMPTILGPQQSTDDDDLWSLVRGGSAPMGDAGSFEEALRRVDKSLERIIAETPAVPEPIVEAVVEEIAIPNGDNPPPARQTDAVDSLGDEEWPWDDDMAGDPSDSAEAARLRRQKLLRRAMENLGAIPQPKISAEQGMVHPSQPAPAPAPKAESSPPPRGEEVELALEIEKRHRDIAEKTDHFAVLGVRRDAGREEVKAAFLNLAKRFHPDRLPPSLPHLAQKITAVFEAIREAYEVLYDDARRQAYLAQLGSNPIAASGSAQGKAAKAAELFKKGEIHFRRRDYAAAEDHFLRAHELDPKATYLAAAGWALYMNPAKRAELGRAKQMMSDALKMDPSCDRAHYQLGVIARVEGDMARAERHFREAVRANPKHLEANQELRLIEMRKKKEEKQGKKGFFR